MAQRFELNSRQPLRRDKGPRRQPAYGDHHSMYRNNTDNHCCGLRAGSLSMGTDRSKGQTSSFSKQCVCTTEHMPRSEYSLRCGALPSVFLETGYPMAGSPFSTTHLAKRSSRITDTCYHTCLYLDPGDLNSGPRIEVCVFPTQSWPQPQKSLLFGCCLCLLGCSTMLILDHKGPKI